MTAANILVTMQTMKMVIAGMAEWSVEQRCSIAGELLDAFATVPRAYIQAISTPLVSYDDMLLSQVLTLGNSFIISLVLAIYLLPSFTPPFLPLPTCTFAQYFSLWPISCPHLSRI